MNVNTKRLETRILLAVALTSLELLGAYNCPILSEKDQLGPRSIPAWPLGMGSLVGYREEYPGETGVREKSGMLVGSPQNGLYSSLHRALEKGPHLTWAGLKLYGVWGWPFSTDPHGSAS